jgi:hypothetical protein
MPVEEFTTSNGGGFSGALLAFEYWYRQATEL